MNIHKNTRNLLLILILIILITIIGCFSVETFQNITRSYIFVPSKTGEYISYLNTLEAFEETANLVKEKEKEKERKREGFIILEMSPTVPMDILQESSSAVPSSITNTEISQGILLPTVKEVVVNRGGNGIVTTTDYMASARNNQKLDEGGIDISDRESLFLPLIDQYPAIDAGKGTIGTVDARECYTADFANKLMLTGNYRQMTNNYKHKYPDSCSGLPEEFIAQFYGKRRLASP